MAIQLTREALRIVFPLAPQSVIDAFASAEGQERLRAAGIMDNVQRLAVAFAHCHHETGGFTIPNLTENINYTAERMAVVWPKRFASAASVKAKYGVGAGWRLKAFDDIYGNRMGNRPGTSDGSLFIGRGAPQVTGRDGYREVGKRAGLPLEAQPELACQPVNQPAILAAFWTWKSLNPLADASGIDGTVRPWNGGTNGLADRKKQFERILPIVAALPNVAGLPPAVAPPKPPIAPVDTPPSSPAKPAVGILGFIGLALLAAWHFFLAHFWLIASGIAALVVLGLIIHRIVKGQWLWTLIGNRLRAQSPQPPRNSLSSLEQASAALSAVSSAASQAAPSPQPLVSKQRRKRSAQRSRKTATRSKNSASSKKPKAAKSLRTRKSKSKS